MFFQTSFPHETVTCDDRDPPWIKNNIKQLIQEKNYTYRSYILKVKCLQTQLKNLIEHSQEKYYLRISKKIMNLMANLKTYWSILKTLLHKKKFLVFLLYFKAATM